MFFQGSKVAGRVIGLAMFPAGKIDADEFEGQSAAGPVVFAIMTFLVVVVVAVSPKLFFNGAASVFVEGLPAELGAAVAHMHGLAVAALSDDGSQAIKLGHLCGAFKALAIGAEGDQETGSQGGAGRQAGCGKWRRRDAGPWPA